MASVKAVYEDGVFKPTEPVELEERTVVEVVLPPAAATDEEIAAEWKKIDEMCGFIKGLPSDMAENHDRYLYGDPEE